MDIQGIGKVKSYHGVPLLNPNNCTMKLMQHYHSCPPVLHPPPPNQTFVLTKETAFYQMISLLAHNLFAIQLLHLIWIAFLKEKVFRILGLHNIGRQITNAINQTDVVEFDPS